MNDRRGFISAVACSVLCVPAIAAAQPGKVWRIGWLAPASATGDATQVARLAAFSQGMRELGYSLGSDYTIEERSVNGRNDLYPALAAELVASRVDVIIAPGTTAALSAQKATATIPIVFVSAGDAVASGLIASMARPGGNLTGRSSITQEMDAKRIELLREAVPGMSSLAVLLVRLGPPGTPLSPLWAQAMAAVEAAARRYGIAVQVSELRSAEQLDATLALMRSRQPSGLIVFDQTLVLSVKERITEFALRSRIPAIYQQREWVDAGGVMSYGPNNTDEYRRLTSYVHRIFKGARPGELPVEQPTRIELVINLKTAKALGITVPQSLLLRADEVIQ